MVSKMLKRLFTRAVFWPAALIGGAGVVGADRPNIVVFLTDDQGYGDLGCYGSDSLETPNIDRLCEQGMKFTDFYVHQRCSPTRLAFMTGSHAHRAGCTIVIYNRDHPEIVADLKRRMETAVKEIETNSHPIGRLAGT